MTQLGLFTSDKNCYNCTTCMLFLDGRLRCNMNLIDVACDEFKEGRFRIFEPETAPVQKVIQKKSKNKLLGG